MSRRLVLVLAACAAVLVVREVRADACGVKLSIKAPRVHKQADRSNNPSQILLLGDPPRALSKELTARGHKVEVAGSADEARRAKYHAIIADADREEEAKTRWPGALVVVRHGSAQADADRIEQQLGSSPTRTLVARTPERTSRSERAPIRTGPPRSDNRGSLVAAGGGAAASDQAVTASSGQSAGAAATAGAADTAKPAGSDGGDDTAQQAAQPTGRARRVATATATEPNPPVPDSEDEVSTAANAPARFTKRIFFGNSTSDLSVRARAHLVRDAKWLQRHEGRSVMVEGHASTTGAPEPNKALSEARARVVKDFLVEQGVNESRIQTVGFGMTRPEYRPGTNGKNRRVVIKLGK